jgi:hypothetical protein
MRILLTSDIKAADGVKAVVYGQSGIGKTVLSASAPTPLVFSSENGLLSLRKHRVPYIDVSTWKELSDAFTWALKSSETRNYQTFVLDSLSDIAEIVLGEEKKANRDPRKAYGNMQDLMYGLIRNFRDLKGKNVTFICKQMTIEDGPGLVLGGQAIKRKTPIMPSSALQNQLPYFFDLVLHMYHAGIDPATNQVWRAVHTQSSPEWDAKDRSGNLNPIEPADLGYLFKKASA